MCYFIYIAMRTVRVFAELLLVPGLFAQKFKTERGINKNKRKGGEADE